MTKQEIGEVANLFGGVARVTILGDNYKKHLLEIEMLLGKARPDSKILDVGGGMGVNLLCLQKLDTTLELHLIDRFEEYTEGNRMGTRGEGLQLLEDAGILVKGQDFWKTLPLPYASEFFDIVTCLDVLEHLPGHPLKLLREMNRVLKKGGTILLSGPNSLSLMSRLRLLLGRYPYTPLELWCNDDYYSHYREYSQKEYCTLLKMAGFNGVKAWTVLQHPQGIERLVYLITIILPRLKPVIYCTAQRS